MSQLLQLATRSGDLATVDGVAAPEYVSQGLPFDATGLAVDTASPIAAYHQGLPFTENGRLAVTQDAGSKDFGSGGAPFVNGRLSMDTAPVARVQAGAPYTSASALGGTGLAPFLGVTITSGPDDTVVNDPDPAVFSITAISGDASPITYQWQQFQSPSWVNLVDGGAVSGATTDTLTLNPSTGLSGLVVRVLASNSQGPTISGSATLTVNSGVTFNVLAENGDTLITEDDVDNIVTEEAA